MKPIAWIVGGVALMGLAAALESLSDFGGNSATRLLLYLPALVALVGGQYCLWRGLRSGIAAFWSGAFDRRKTSPSLSDAQPADPFTDVGQNDDFDADAIIARYLAARESKPDDPVDQTRAPAAAQPAKPTFGRRIV